jgi:hypothetical protein
VADSLLVASTIELIGAEGGVPSTLPQCAGAVFTVDQELDMGAPQPVVDIVQSLVLDGERPYGTRASNRTVTLPVQISASDRLTLAAAREALLELIDQQTWTLTWTRDGGLPLVLDCFRANPSKPAYNLVDDKQFYATLTIEFQALPYGRSDTSSQLSFGSPLTGSIAPPSPVTLDNYSSVSGTDWSQSTQHIIGPDSARWDGSEDESQPYAFYEASVGPADLTGLTALSVWAGFGSDFYYFYYYFGSPPVTFSWTLTDGSGNTISFGTTRSVTVGATGDTPAWKQITAKIPQVSGFDYTTVSAYSVTITNFAGGGGQALQFLVAYLDDLTANPPTFGSAPGIRGAIYTLFGINGTSHAPLSLQFQQPPVSVPTTVTLTGSGMWTSPVAEAAVSGTGGSGAGAGLTGSGHGGGAGAGAFAEEPALALTIGNAYPYSVGAAGTQGSSPVNGGATSFAGDDTTVLAAGGLSAAQNSSTGARGGAAGANTVAYAGGNGANGTGSGGGGGGQAASATGQGLSATGTAGAGSGAGHGGSGATGSANGSAGTFPGGAGGGANSAGAAKNGGAGSAGTLTVSYSTSSLSTWSALIAHRPGLAAPPSLNPLVTVGSGSDTPNGGTQYAVQSLTSGVNAQFGSTYSVVLCASGWNSSGSSRTVTVEVIQFEYTGGPSSSVSVSRTFTPASDVTNDLVSIGELTLPGKDLAPENTSAYFVVTVTDTNTSDRFLDCLFLDTLGQTTWISTSVSGYTTYFIDEPTTDRDLGRVMGSPSDRTEAISVMDSTIVSGGPLFVDPGDNTLLVYSPSGAPALVATYSPRWFLDRTS